MRPEDARKEVVSKVAAACGFEVDESTLSPGTRQAISRLAATFRELVMAEQMLRLEKRSHGRVAMKIRKGLRMAEDEKVVRYGSDAERLRSQLNDGVGAVVRQILDEREAGRPPGPAALELRCPSCGANLDPASTGAVRCAYCGTECDMEKLGAP
ncbi:MAG: hypothetical protein JRN39_03515 [Nitrososphaerota archaeon]|nr:hypothetical protein [Nitrososphaerota archaeon]MDG6939452.1 hypothetical protein [Nitrososphaerota archaeon]